MVNEPLPRQMTVRQLMNVLATQQPEAVVAWKDTWNQNFAILCNVRIERADGGPTVVLTMQEEIE